MNHLAASCGDLDPEERLKGFNIIMQKLSLKNIEDLIVKAKPEDQRQFLAKLPHLLKLSTDDFFWRKASESSFEFWNNPEDVIYDSL